MGSHPTLAHPNPTRDPEELSASPAPHRPTAETQPSRDLEQAFDRLNPDYGVPADTHNPDGQQAVRDREAALALGTRVAVATSRENDPNPVHVAGRPGLPSRRRHPPGPRPDHPPTIRPGTAGPRTLNPATHPIEEGAPLMAADNQTTIAGNLVETPELRFTNTGTPVTNLRVAVTQRDPAGWGVARRRDLVLQGECVARPG